MAQKRNPVTPGNDPAAGDYTARGKSPRQIERDIDATRSEMSETLDELGNRLDPSHLKEEAKDQVMDFLHGPAADVGGSIMETVKQHPVPALAAALSIGWLVVKSGESDQDRRLEDDYYGRYGRYPAPGYARYVRQTGRYHEVYGGDYGDGGSDSGRSLTDKASDLKDKAGDLADEATDRLHDAGDQARRYRRRASNWLEQQMDENPMIVGALALATGALVGLSVPETHAEDEWMGETSDRLVSRAKDVAEDKLSEAKKAAKDVAETAKSKAKDVADTAEKEAKKAAKESAKPAPKVTSKATANKPKAKVANVNQPKASRSKSGKA